MKACRISVVKAKLLIPFKEIIAVDCDNHKKYVCINKLCDMYIFWVLKDVVVIVTTVF